MAEKQGLDRAKELLDRMFRPEELPDCIVQSGEDILRCATEPTGEELPHTVEFRRRDYHHTEAVKRQQSITMKAYWARRKAEKAVAWGPSNTNWDYSI